MGNPKDIKNLVEYLDYGDYSLIKDLYDERHRMGNKPDNKTVSRQYVKMVLSGERTTIRKGTAADEILLIATKYLKHKRDFRLNIQAI